MQFNIKNTIGTPEAPEGRGWNPHLNKGKQEGVPPKGQRKEVFKKMRIDVTTLSYNELTAAFATAPFEVRQLGRVGARVVLDCTPV